MGKYTILLIFACMVGYYNFSMKASEDENQSGTLDKAKVVSAHTKSNFWDFGEYFNTLSRELQVSIIEAMIAESKTVKEALVQITRLCRVNSSFDALINAVVFNNPHLCDSLIDRIHQELFHEICENSENHKQITLFKLLELAAFNQKEELFQQYLPMLRLLGMTKKQNDLALHVLTGITKSYINLNLADEKNNRIVSRVFEYGGSLGNSDNELIVGILTKLIDVGMKKTAVTMMQHLDCATIMKSYKQDLGRGTAKNQRFIREHHHACKNCFPSYYHTIRSYFLPRIGW